MDALDALMDDEGLAGLMLKIQDGRWPESPLIPVEKPFKNDAGEIWNLAWGNFASASAVRSVAGAVRSNHFHKTDWHFMYVASGVMQYYWRPAGSIATPSRLRCPAGTLVFTAPMIEHATFFPTETLVVTFNRRTRDHDSHEADVVRVPPLVTTEVCPAVLHGHRCTLPYQYIETRDFRNPIHDGDHEDQDGNTFSFPSLPG